MQDWAEFVIVSVIASILVPIAVVGTNERVRDRREREIYRQTRQRK
jgi:hypothetical protein